MKPSNKIYDLQPVTNQFPDCQESADQNRPAGRTAPQLSGQERTRMRTNKRNININNKPVLDDTGEDSIPVGGFRGEESLPPGGFRGEESLPPGGFRGEESLPAGGFRGEESLPPGGFRSGGAAS